MKQTGNTYFTENQILSHSGFREPLLSNDENINTNNNHHHIINGGNSNSSSGSDSVEQIKQLKNKNVRYINKLLLDRDVFYDNQHDNDGTRSGGVDNDGQSITSADMDVAFNEDVENGEHGGGLHNDHNTVLGSLSHEEDVEEEDDDDVIFIKEVPAAAATTTTTSGITSGITSGTSKNNYITNSKKRKVSITEQPVFKKSTLNHFNQQKPDFNMDDEEDEGDYDEFIEEQEDEEDEEEDDEDFKTDADGYYIFEKNKYVYNRRYITKELLGGGTFSKVIKVYDNLTKDYKAIKIIKNIDRYRQAAKNEIKVLNTLSKYSNSFYSQVGYQQQQQQNDGENYPILELLQYFDIRNHICLVTDTYPCSVYDFMSSNAIPRFPGSHVQSMGKQLVESIIFLHSLGIIHTDLKPENMLLQSTEDCLEYQMSPDQCKLLSTRRLKASNNGKRKVLRKTEIKLIDFGSAIFAREFHPSIISTRHYRAPEVILGYKWSFPCDVWSIGCVLYELATGETLFPIHDNEKHLIMIQRLFNENIQLNPNLINKNQYAAAPTTTTTSTTTSISNDINNSSSGNGFNILLKNGTINTKVINSNTKEILHMFNPSCDYKFDWTIFDPKLNSPPGARRSLYQTESAKVLSTCSRLDKMLTFKLKKYIPWLELLNFELSMEENWSFIQETNSRNFTGSNNNSNGNSVNHTPSPLTPNSTVSSDFLYENMDFEKFQFWYLFVDLLRNVFAIDPTKRWTARELISHPWFHCSVSDEGTMVSSASTGSLSNSPEYTTTRVPVSFQNEDYNQNNVPLNSLSQMKEQMKTMNNTKYHDLPSQVRQQHNMGHRRNISNDTESTANLTSRLNDLKTTF